MVARGGGTPLQLVAKTSMVLGGDGNPIIAYCDVTNGDLKVADCANPACTAKTITSVDRGHVGWYRSIVLDSDGFPIISYSELRTGSLKVAQG